MTMFERIKELAKMKGKNLKQVALDMGFGENYFYTLKTQSPKAETLERVADYFNVSTDYLLGRTDKKHHNDLTEQDEKDIAKRIDEFKKDIASSDGLNFSGEPMSEDAKESLIEAMDHIFRQTQRINKKYIPPKNKKDED